MKYYGIILTIICAVDLLLTTVGITLGEITEKSPILSWYYLEWDIYGLIGVKAYLNASSAFILEIIARKKLISEKRISFYYSFAITVYLLGFLGGSIYTTLTY